MYDNLAFVVGILQLAAFVGFMYFGIKAAEIYLRK